MSKRPTLKDFRQKALQDPAVKAEYDALAVSFEIKRQMISMRKKAGLTQEQMAELLGTKKSNISRLESLHEKGSPRLSTIENYAQALGYVVKVDFTQGPTPAH